MMRAWCPECDELLEITPTGEKRHEGYSSEWQRIVMHKHPTKPEICKGSGRKV